MLLYDINKESIFSEFSFIILYNSFSFKLLFNKLSIDIKSLLLLSLALLIFWLNSLFFEFKFLLFNIITSLSDSFCSSLITPRFEFIVLEIILFFIGLNSAFSFSIILLRLSRFKSLLSLSYIGKILFSEISIITTIYFSEWDNDFIRLFVLIF